MIYQKKERKKVFFISTNMFTLTGQFSYNDIKGHETRDKRFCLWQGEWEWYDGMRVDRERWIKNKE